MLNPFTPGPTVTLAVTAINTTTPLPTGISGQVMITCPPDGSLAFVQFGGPSVVAAPATSTPILPSAAYIFSVGPSVTHVAAICASGTSTIYATRGQGD